MLRLRQPTRWVLNLALFLAAMAAIGGWLGERRSDRSSVLIDGKRRHVCAEESPYDTLVFGSSRVHSGFVPGVFDRRMAELGHPSRSFNMGVGGMFGHEVNVLLRRVLENPPPRLRRVFIEVARWDPTINQKNRLTRRATAWHTPREFLPICRSRCRLSLETGVPPLPGISDHFAHLLAYWTNLGAGPTIWVDGFEPDLDVDAQFAPMVAKAGYEPMTVRGGPRFAQWRETFLEAIDASYPARVDNKRRSSFDTRMGGLLNPDALVKQCHHVLQQDIELIYFVPPTTKPVSVPRWLDDGAAGVACLRFDVPDRYPDLYEASHRFDFEHLSNSGAERWSAAMADRYVESL